MKKECEIARDLMPLVIDEVAAQGSKETVSSHVAQCPDCAAYLAQLKANIPAGNAKETEDDRKALHAFAAKLRQKKWLRALRWAALGGLAACIVFFGCVLLGSVTVPAKLDTYRISLSQRADGAVIINTDYQGAAVPLCPSISIVLEKDKATGAEIRVCYIRMTRHLLSERVESLMQNHGIISRQSILTCDEIRQGTPKNYTVIWKQGDQLPAASAEMEAYYQWQKLITRVCEEFWIETPAGKMFMPYTETSQRLDLMYAQLDFLQSQVPEWQPWVGEPVESLDDATLRWLLEGDGEALTD